MKRSSGPRKTAFKFPESVRHQLNRLAIAIILAGAGLFALAWPAGAQIVYKPTVITVKENSSYNLDLNKDGVTDFIISTNQSVQRCGPGQQGPYDTVAETAASGNAAVGSPAALLQEGQQIGPSQAFYGGTGGMAWTFFCNGGSTGGDNWIDEQYCGYMCEHLTFLTGYLGLMFQVNGETYYGWALLSVKLRRENFDLVVTLHGYAYETTPGVPINAGQTQ